MGLYRYRALTVNGKKHSGMINADTIDLAKERLRQERILVTKIFECQRNREVVLSSSLLLLFTRDLSLLLHASLPLYESLQALEEKYRGSKMHPFYLEVCDRIKHGRSLSQALEAHPKSFNQVYISMVKAGEETGFLPNIFDQLSKLIAKQEKLKKQIQAAMTYPTFLASFCLIIIIALFYYLIPSLQDLFEDKQLHPMTSVVIALSNWVQLYGGYLAAGILGGIACLVVAIQQAKGKAFLKNLGLKIPILKKMMTLSVLLRFTKVFSVLLTNGVSMLQALALSRKSMNHPLFEEVVKKAEKKIIEGKQLSRELQSSPLFPKLFIRMLAVSEEAGNISEMLENIGDIYEQDLEKSLTRFTSLLQPIMLLVLGLIVGVVLLSVLLPLTDVSSFVQ